MHKKIPMRPAKMFTEQINVKVTPEIKDKIRRLKSSGVDLGELYRDALVPAIELALKST